MIAFIDTYRGAFGVEPICRVLPIAPSTYSARASVRRDPGRASTRAKSDAALGGEIKRVHDTRRGRYGARKVWHPWRREGHAIARCTVERLMKTLGLQGLVRGGRKKTTWPDPAQPCPNDRVNRHFKALSPDRLWVADFTSVPCWTGTVHVAFISDVYARRIVGWRVSSTLTTDLVLDALNPAICQRNPGKDSDLIHQSDRGSQSLSITYSERLLEVGIDPSVGSVGDSYDNALAESVIGLFKTEVIRLLGPWKSIGQVEWETCKWVHWYNNERLHIAIHYITPEEKERNCYATMTGLDKVA